MSAHGLPSTYQHGCRCEPCLRSVTMYRQDLRARQGAYCFRRLPVAPLYWALHLRARRIGTKELARRYSFRYNVPAASPERFLTRLPKQRYVREDVADLWLTLVGLHLDLVYEPEEAA